MIAYNHAKVQEKTWWACLLGTCVALFQMNRCIEYTSIISHIWNHIYSLSLSLSLSLLFLDFIPPSPLRAVHLLRTESDTISDLLPSFKTGGHYLKPSIKITHFPHINISQFISTRNMQSSMSNIFQFILTKSSILIKVVYLLI